MKKLLTTGFSLRKEHPYLGERKVMKVSVLQMFSHTFKCTFLRGAFSSILVSRGIDKLLWSPIWKKVTPGLLPCNWTVQRVSKVTLHPSLACVVRKCMPHNRTWNIRCQREVGIRIDVFCSAGNWAIHLLSFIMKNRGVFSSLVINSQVKSHNHHHMSDFITPNKCLLLAFPHRF